VPNAGNDVRRRSCSTRVTYADDIIVKKVSTFKLYAGNYCSSLSHASITNIAFFQFLTTAIPVQMIPHAGNVTKLDMDTGHAPMWQHLLKVMPGLFSFLSVFFKATSCQLTVPFEVKVLPLCTNAKDNDKHSRTLVRHKGQKRVFWDKSGAGMGEQHISANRHQAVPTAVPTDIRQR